MRNIIANKTHPIGKMDLGPILLQPKIMVYFLPELLGAFEIDYLFPIAIRNDHQRKKIWYFLYLLNMYVHISDDRRPRWPSAHRPYFL